MIRFLEIDLWGKTLFEFSNVQFDTYTMQLFYRYTPILEIP